MKSPINFNLENTIQVLNDTLVDEYVTEESLLILAIREAGVRGVKQAILIDEPGRVLTLEIISEDEKTYQLAIARRVFSDITYIKI